MRANFVHIYLQGMRDRSMWSGTELVQEIQLTDWSMAGNLFNQSSGVQILCDIFFSFWALFVLNEVQLDNKMLYFPYRGNKKMCVCVCVCVCIK